MAERRVKLFKNGHNQAVRIPREFELRGEDAIIRKEGQRLIIEPAPPKSLPSIQTFKRSMKHFRQSTIRRQSLLTCDDAVSARHRYLVDLVRRPHGRIADRIKRVGERRVCTSIIVAAELRYDGAKKGSSRLKKQLETVLNALDVLALETPADTLYGELRGRSERAGQTIGANDCS